MLPKTKRKTELFNDGVLSVWKGQEHVLVEEKFKNLRYGNKKIGMMRQYHDQIFDEKTDKLIVVPPNPFVESNDIVIIKDKQFHIRKIEHETLNQTKVMKLTLEEVKIKFTKKQET